MEDQLYIIGSDIELMVMFCWNNEDIGVTYLYNNVLLCL